MPYQSPQKAYPLARGILLDQYDALERDAGHPARLWGPFPPAAAMVVMVVLPLGGHVTNIFYSYVDFTYTKLF